MTAQLSAEDVVFVAQGLVGNVRCSTPERVAAVVPGPVPVPVPVSWCSVSERSRRENVNDLFLWLFVGLTRTGEPEPAEFDRCSRRNHAT